MLEIRYEKVIPYSIEIVLSQYFDYEHIAHVHPRTVGEYRLLEQNGNEITYLQIWPPNLFGRRAVSRVRHIFEPPYAMQFVFIAGRYRGITVRTELAECSPGTVVRETYALPLPAWGWLGSLIRPAMMKSIDKIWEEDLRVEVCIDGWPGVPGRGRQFHPPAGVPRRLGSRRFLCRADELPTGQARAFKVGDGEVAVFSTGEGYHAISGRCPHTGGPLALGNLESGCVVCPWHGARFDLASGAPRSEVTDRRIAVHEAAVEAGDLVVYLQPEDTRQEQLPTPGPPPSP